MSSAGCGSTNLANNNTKPESGVSTQDWYSTGNHDPQVEDARRRPVLYTANGQPLGKNPQKIGFKRT
jgi:hypothetical protein